MGSARIFSKARPASENDRSDDVINAGTPSRLNATRDSFLIASALFYQYSKTSITLNFNVLRSALFQ
jgi:hypothetical protein